MAELKESGAQLGTKANTFQLISGDTFICQGESEIGNGVIRPLGGGIGGLQGSEIRLNAPFSLDLEINDPSSSNFPLSAYITTLFGGASDLHNGKTLRISIRLDGIVKGIKKSHTGVWKNSIDFIIEALSPLTRHTGQFGFAEEEIFVNLGAGDGNKDCTIYCEIINTSIVASAVVHIYKQIETNIIVQNQPYTYSRGARMPIRVFFKDNDDNNLTAYHGQQAKIWLTIGKESIEVPKAPEWPTDDPEYTQADYELDYAATVYAGALRVQKVAGDGFTTTVEILIEEFADGTVGFSTEIYPEIYSSDYTDGIPNIANEEEPNEDNWSNRHSYQDYLPWEDIPPLGEHDLKTLICHIEVANTTVRGYGISKISDKPPHVMMVVCDETDPAYYPHGLDTFHEDLQSYRSITRYGMRIEPNIMKDPTEYAALEDAKILADINMVNLTNAYNTASDDLAVKTVTYLQKQAEADADPANPDKAAAALEALLAKEDAQQIVNDALLALQDGQTVQDEATQALDEYDGIAYGDLLYNPSKRYGEPRIADRREEYVNTVIAAESELTSTIYLRDRAQVRYDAIDPTDITQKEIALATLNDWENQVITKTQTKNDADAALANFEASITSEEVTWESENPDERPTMEEIWSCSRGVLLTVTVPGGRYMWGKDIMPRDQLVSVDYKITECGYGDSNLKSNFINSFNTVCSGNYPKMAHLIIDVSKDDWIWTSNHFVECMSSLALGRALTHFEYWLDRICNYGNHPDRDDVENIPDGIIYHNNHLQYRSYNTFEHERWLKAATELLIQCFERKFEPSLCWWDIPAMWVPGGMQWYYLPVLNNLLEDFGVQKYY